MPYSPMEGFEIGRNIGKSRKSTFARASGSLMEQFGERQKMGGELMKGMLLEKFKSGIESPKEKAMTDYYNAKTQSLLTPESQQQKVFKFNRTTGKIAEMGSVPKGARVMYERTPTEGEATALSTGDVLIKTLGDMKGMLSKDPNIALRARVPLLERDYKAAYRIARRYVAQMVGGKTLTLPERQIVSETFPTEADVIEPQVMQRKLDAMIDFVNGVKGRLQQGQYEGVGEIPESGVTDSNDVDDEESDYQEWKRSISGN